MPNIITENWAQSKSRQPIELQCDFCHKVYTLEKYRLQNRLLHSLNGFLFCSKSCHYEHRVTRVKCSCLNCGREFERAKCEAVGNTFCSRNCSALYNNSHKSFGTRRSKLEQYIETKIRQHFPSLQMVCNGKSTIGSELDYYFPDLKLAIELNGIVHYEPIYGSDKFESIKANDQGKFSKCMNLGIELAVMDVSACKRYEKQKDNYWNIVRELLLSVSSRQHLLL